jgi:choline dehydrogenase-like flavoprotein
MEWSYIQFLSDIKANSPYYMKSETFHRPSPESQKDNKQFYDESVLGTSGPIQITYVKECSTSHHYWHDTLNNLGVKTNTSHLAGSNVGVWTDMLSIDPESQTRSYSLNAYISPKSQQENIVILTEALAKEVVLEKNETGDGWIARGVRFAHGNGEHIVSVSREVILSAGAIKSPQILELSGVGNPNVLRAAGIRVKVANDNVGERLQDHLSRLTPFYNMHQFLTMVQCWRQYTKLIQL